MYTKYWKKWTTSFWDYHGQQTETQPHPCLYVCMHQNRTVTSSQHLPNLAHWFDWEKAFRNGNASLHTQQWWWWWLLPHLQGFWENVRLFNARLCFFLFFKVEISWHTLIPLFMPGRVHGGSASCDDCGQMFPDKLHVSCFCHIILDRFPYYAWTAA